MKLNKEPKLYQHMKFHAPLGLLGAKLLDAAEGLVACSAMMDFPQGGQLRFWVKIDPYLEMGTAVRGRKNAKAPPLAWAVISHELWRQIEERLSFRRAPEHARPEVDTRWMALSWSLVSLFGKPVPV